MDLKRRIEELEREAGALPRGHGWSPPIVEIRPGDDPAETEANLKKIEQEAQAAGCEGICMIIVNLAEADNELEATR